MLTNRSGPRQAWVCAIALFASLGCAHASKAPLAKAPLVPQAPQAGHMHVVQPGETLYRIAQHEGVSVDALEGENGIDDPSQLDVGQTLFIPGRRGASAANQASMLGATSDTSRVSPIGPKDRGEPRLLWPVRGVIFSTFGHRGGEHHDGVDLAAPEGTTIVAAADGTVLFAGEQRGYGTILLVQHAGDLVTVYAHNSENLARAGDRVVRGQAIARVGKTGNASGPHVHFEVRVAAQPRDPLEFLR